MPSAAAKDLPKASAAPLSAASAARLLKEGHFELLQRAVEEGRLDPNAAFHQPTHGCALIHLVAHEGAVELLRYLVVEHGVDPRQRTSVGWSPLDAAIDGRREDAALFLMDAGGLDADSRGPGGTTALMHAAASGTPRVLHALFEAGADREACDEDGRTALDHACLQREAAATDVVVLGEVVSLLEGRHDSAGSAAMVPLLLPPLPDDDDDNSVEGGGSSTGCMVPMGASVAEARVSSSREGGGTDEAGGGAGGDSCAVAAPAVVELPALVFSSAAAGAPTPTPAAAASSSSLLLPSTAEASFLLAAPEAVAAAAPRRERTGGTLFLHVTDGSFWISHVKGRGEARKQVDIKVTPSFVEREGEEVIYPTSVHKRYVDLRGADSCASFATLVH